MAHHTKTTTNQKFPSRPKPNDGSRGILGQHETKRRRQEDHHFVPITKQLLPHHKIPTVSPHATKNTSLTQAPLPNPHNSDHVLQDTQTWPHTDQDTCTHPKNPSLSLLIHTTTNVQEKTILVSSSQTDMNDDSNDNDDKNEANHDSTLSCEEDMVT